MTRRVHLVIVLIGAAWLARGAGARQQDPREVERVLFVGNSLTAFNNLPGLVEALSRTTAGPILSSAAVVYPDHSLEDHWARGDAVRTIGRGGWSFVVLQQGPSALPESQVLLREYTKRFDGVIRKAGARTALYMVWPSRSRAQDRDGVSRSYTAAAHDVGGLLLPAGDAWRTAWQRDATLPLYADDGLHPSPMGSYLAALVIYQGLTGRSPVGLPASVATTPGAAPIVIPAPQAKLLQEVARATVITK